MTGGLAVRHPWQSLVPVAVDALIALLQDQATSPEYGFVVHDGPFVSEATDPQIIIVGWGGFYPGYAYPSRGFSENVANAAVSASQDSGGLGPTQRERFQISMASLVRSGSSHHRDMSRARSLAYFNAAAVGRICQSSLATPAGPGAASYLGATGVKRAIIAPGHQLHLVQDRRGILAMLSFGLECEGWSQQ